MKLGLYVHIPFCKSKCYYCDFLSFPGKNEEAYVDALVQELKRYGEAVKGKHTITSIFIGGGTPTVLSPFLLEKVCQTINEVFVKEETIEWTIEANPGTITKDHAEVMKKCGVNRVSLGLQACQSYLLKKIGRIHSAEVWKESIQLLKEVGIEQINTDLMFGLPEQSLEDWKETLQQVTQAGIGHLSAYGLIVEEGTPFYQMEQEGNLRLPTEEVERAMYEVAKQYLSEKGYRHYEISNWAKPGQACKHNLLYWDQGCYIGVGLGAHGYMNHIRYHNTHNFEDYLKAQGDLKQLVVEEEVITQKMQMEEFMFLGLRLIDGVSKEAFQQRFGKRIQEIYGEVILKWIKEGLLVETNERIYLTNEGLNLSNQVMSSFLLDE